MRGSRELGGVLALVTLAGSLWLMVGEGPRAADARLQAAPVTANAEGSTVKPAENAADKSGDKAADDVEVPVKSTVSGRVVMLTEALKRRGIKSYAEENKGQVVLETAAGELLPIVPDWRGRALFQDERLRDRAVDLLVYRHRGVPHLQVLSIFTFDDQGVRQLTDYWCDICSIPMYEIKDCECCQGPIRLRFRKADE